MFKLKFHKSKSKYYKQAAGIASNFYQHSFVEDVHEISISVKELFEKWDYFNKIFWTTASWNGSTFGYDDYDLHSISAKKRLFYSLQQAYSEWLCMTSWYLKQIAGSYFEDSFDEELREKIFNEKDVDRILDLLNAEKYRINFKQEFENE